jgi:hypothetical protein
MVGVVRVTGMIPFIIVAWVWQGVAMDSLKYGRFRGGRLQSGMPATVFYILFFYKNTFFQLSLNVPNFLPI